MMLKYSYFGPMARFQDPEQWGRAFAYSVLIHTFLVLMLIISFIQRKPDMRTTLTHINFIERRAPVKVPGEIRMESKRKKLSVGRGESGPSGLPESIEKKVDLSKTVASPIGKTKETVVQLEALTHPIVNLEDFGEIGKKKGALMPLGSVVQKGRSGGLLALPGDEKSKKGSPILLAKMSVDEIRKRESSIGSPIVSKKLVAKSMNGKLKELAEPAVGKKRKMSSRDLKSNPLEREKWGKRKGPFTLEGPLKYRKIRKMDLPPYPRWAEEQGIEASVSIRLWADPKGRVKDNMYLEKTSGYSELDFLAKEALKKFLFVPIPDNLLQEDEWGVATFRFELTK